MIAIPKPDPLDRLTPSEASLFLMGYRSALLGLADRVDKWALEDLVNALYESARELQDALPRADGLRTDVGWKQLQGLVEDKVEIVQSLHKVSMPPPSTFSLPNPARPRPGRKPFVLPRKRTEAGVAR